MADSGLSLSQLYDELWSTYQYLETTDDSCTSETYQEKAKTGLEKAEIGITMVNQLEIFSTNEEIEEITTNEIRYMTMSALGGYFCYKINRGDRLEILEKCRSHWINFIRLCRDYGLTSARIPGEKRTSSAKPGSQEEIVQMANQRQSKIERFKKQKEDDKRLKELYEKVKREHVDEEIKRDYYTTLVQKFVTTSLEDVDAIDREIPMLKRMAELGGPGMAPPAEPKPKTKYGTPFILTKNEMQKQVFGMGYTNLPTYSIEEFYEKEAAAGRLPGPGDEVPANPTPDQVADSEEQEKIDKEEKVEKDDEENLMKQRGWDDWKDDHRRGWGNRQNMG